MKYEDSLAYHDMKLFIKKCNYSKCPCADIESTQINCYQDGFPQHLKAAEHMHVSCYIQHCIEQHLKAKDENI